MSRRVLFIVLTIVLTIAGALACGSILSLPDDATPSAAEAGSKPGDGGAADGQEGVDGAASGDGSGTNIIDAGPDCALIINEPNITIDATYPWKVLGAKNDPFNTGVVLTENTTNTMGALWSNKIELGSVLHVTVDYTIANKTGTEAEGLAVAFVGVSTNPALTDAGDRFGVCANGREGVAAIAATKLGDLIIVPVDTCTIVDSVNADVVNGTNHRLVVDFTANDIKATLSNNSGSSNVAGITHLVPLVGYLVLSASTGSGGGAQHIVNAVKVERCR